MGRQWGFNHGMQLGTSLGLQACRLKARVGRGEGRGGVYAKENASLKHSDFRCIVGRVQASDV